MTTVRSPVTAKALRRTTLAEIKRDWPPAIDVGQAAIALGVSRSSLYEAIRTNRCCVRTISVNRRIKVLTASLISVLESGATGADQAPVAQVDSPNAPRTERSA